MNRHRSIFAVLAFTTFACGDDAEGPSTFDAAVATPDARVSVTFDAAPAPTLVLEARFGTAADTIGDGTAELAKTIKDLTGLEVMVTGTPMGANATRVVDRVNDGTVDMGLDILSIVTSGKDPKLDLVWDFYGESIPFGFQTDEYIGWLYSGGGLALLGEMNTKKGYSSELAVAPALAITGQAGGMFKGAITDARFQTGFLFRTSGVGQQIMKQAYPNMKFIGAVGGGVANIVAGFKGTLTGPDCSEAGADPCTLQGAEFVGPCIDGNQIYGQGIADSGVTHYVVTQWQSSATILFLVYKKDNPKLAGMADRIAIAAKASLADSNQRLLSRQSECLKQLADTRGQTLMTYPQEIVDKFKTATIAVLNEQAAADADVAAVLASMRTFAGKNQAWWNQGAIARAYRFLGWTGWESVVKVN